MLLSKLCPSSLIYDVKRRNPKVQLSSQARKRKKRLATIMAKAGNQSAEATAGAKAVVFYHYPCPDGIFAAFAAHLYHAAIGCRALFVPHTVYQPLRIPDLNVERADICYLLDFAGPAGFALELSRVAKQVIILDHHKTALERLPQQGQGPANLLCVLDLNRSGATIAFDYFEEMLLSRSKDMKALSDTVQITSLVPGTNTNSQKVKDLFKYIEDADLWRWALPDSKAFSSGLNDMGIEFNAVCNPRVFEQLLELNVEEIIAKGHESLKVKQAAIDELLDRSFRLDLGRGQYGQCLAVQADSVGHLRSELGNQLAGKSLESGLRPIGAVVYVQPGFQESGRQYKVSLRSMGENVDTTEISEAYGGGGHQKASSFLIDRAELEQWKCR